MTMMNSPSVPVSLKKDFPSVYAKHYGHMWNTAKALGIPRATLARMCSEDPDLQSAKQDFDDRLIDDAAAHAYKLGTGKERGNIGPPAFVLKAKGGWTDRQEITHKHQGFEANAPAGVDGVLTLDGGGPPDTRGGRCDGEEVPPDNCGSSEVLDNVIQLAREGCNERS